ncbi:uncharacterized protein BP01DRAFT_385304 [Aspergillus saccharolyticus JOP 1030-1]|uniref:Uncharacterized protein n=1 Tax=Aspergillus saccharolyticus JOP 1030-1 TaxID=1450539 RepID=A0A318Z686_9EURO|nr:hypothetical protein BP01DRAFT_385304 [Aspergillus saccharolyticus JOP 1030-1]PYH42646.1 hypothetical protein BP01DRAFT_385304 [Aspergillus saccharolyticus JOP 1030-1]
MSSGNKQTQKPSNETISSLSPGNLSQIPDDTSGSMVERFKQAPAADEPYFAQARMQDRSQHISRLSSQLEEAEKALRKS